MNEISPEFSGILDIVDSRAYVRTSGYAKGSGDVTVPRNLVREHDLRRGDFVTGSTATHGKAGAATVDTVNGVQPRPGRPRFDTLIPVHPTDRLRLEAAPTELTGRVMDLMVPAGKGQRMLIVAPPKAGKTSVLQAIASSIGRNHPECHLMTVLVGERPEEVTDLERTVRGEVISSTFDCPPAEHTAIAELAVERAKRLVELGQDVVLLLDSLTRLGRAYNLAARTSGRVLSGGIDSSALHPPKRLLGAARDIEGGGSLTIFATALVNTGSAGDALIFEEFKGTGNSELRLDRDIAGKRIFPSVDVGSSSTRKEELLLTAEEFAVTSRLRKALGTRDTEHAIGFLIDGLRKTRTNREFLAKVAC